MKKVYGIYVFTCIDDDEHLFAIKNKKANTDKIKFKQLNNEVLKKMSKLDRRETTKGPLGHCEIISYILNQYFNFLLKIFDGLL